MKLTPVAVEDIEYYLDHRGPDDFTELTWREFFIHDYFKGIVPSNDELLSCFVDQAIESFDERFGGIRH